jgi:hypothetical protein
MKKLSKRLYLTVTQSGKCGPTRGFRSDIYTVHQDFALRLMHRKGSSRPAGYYHDGFGSYDAKVEVTWQWTDDLGYYAPEISFRPSARALKIVNKIAKALHEIRNKRDVNPDDLTEMLKATVVEYCEDNNRGDPELYDDYRPIRVPGECAMATLARAAL